MLTNISVYTGAPFRDPIPSARKFYHRRPSEESQFVVLWKDGKCFAVDKKNNHTELLYAHFFRRNFEILNLLKSVKRYGIRKTVARQKWSKDHDQYVHRLEKEYRK